MDGRLELSNNKAERAVKSLVMGERIKLAFSHKALTVLSQQELS